MAANTTFIKITNKDIYFKLIDIENQAKITNGKVKLNTWRSVTALSLTISVIIVLLGNRLGVLI